jgi:hypothetical protein
MKRYRRELGEAGVGVVFFLMCGVLGWLCGLTLAAEMVR